MATANPPQFITDWYHSCIDIFEQITASVDNLTPGQDYEAKALALQLVDQIGRFRVWGANMGAHHQAGSRLSLDYKLREASYIHNTVVKLLKKLNTSLESTYILNLIFRLGGLVINVIKYFARHKKAF